MALNFRSAPNSYDRDDQSQLRAMLEAEDRRNVKLGISSIFTPTLGDGTNNYTLSFAEGYYTKLANLVFWQALMIWTSIGSAGATRLRMGGLPLTSVNLSLIQFPVTIGQMEGIDTTATANQIVCNMGGNSTTAHFFRVNDNSTQTDLPSNGSSASGRLYLSSHYMVSN